MIKRLTLILSFLILVCVPLASYAQNTIPWPPDPKTLFADGVELVNIATPPDLPANEPPVADDDARVVRVYDNASNSWYEYPYPDGVNTLSNGINVRSDGSIVLNLYSYSSQADIWILDPQTGNFSLAEIVCQSRVKDLPGQGFWLYVYSDSQTRLCFTETGVESDPLPDDILWLNGADFGVAPSPTPDGTMVALAGFNMEGAPDGYPVVYSYEVASGTLTYLGTVDDYTGDVGGNQFMKWVSDTQGIFYIGPSQESLRKQYYGFDVTQPDSLHSIYTGWLYDYHPDPARYEAVTTTAFLQDKTGAEVPNHIPCQFMIYDAHDVHNFTLGYDCSRATVLQAGEGYFYVRIDSNPSTVSTLVYLDPNTGEQTELVSGEIETLEGASPDGRYVLLGMDKNNHIDAVDYFFDPPWYDWAMLQDAYLAIFDTVMGKFVYQTESYNGSEASWLDNHSLMLLTYPITYAPNATGENQTIPESLYLIDLVEDVPRIAKVDGIATASAQLLAPDRQHLVATREDASNLVVVDFTTQTFVPLLKLPEHDVYALVFNWTDNGLLEIKVNPKIGWQIDTSRSVIYTVRVPQAES